MLNPTTSDTLNVKKERPRRESAILSMPKESYRPLQLLETSPVSKMAIYEVESVNSGDQYLMKSIKNENCVPLQLKYELDRLKSLHHPNFAKVAFVDYGEAYSYVIFERAKGQPLWTPEQSQIYPETVVRAITYQLARCMQFSHAVGIVHRDLRPANVIVHFPSSDMNNPVVKLVDFRTTKCLLPIERLAILEDGSAFPAAYVRQQIGQYPAPEVLMDLKHDSQVDSWFLGTFMYLLISGTIPFTGQDNEAIKKSILYEPVNFGHPAWLKVSNSLDEIINGLLIKDARKRWSIDRILWDKWIRKFHYVNMIKLILTVWLRKAQLTLDFESMVQVQTYSMFGLHAALSGREQQLIRRTREEKKLQKKNRQKMKYKYLQPMSNEDRISIHNHGTTVIHQCKVWSNDDQPSPNTSAPTESFITCSANVWIGQDSNPFTFEYIVEYAKYDIFVGVITEDYRQPNDEKQSLKHHIGMNDTSVGISIRNRVAYFNGTALTNLDTSQVSVRPLNSYNYVQLFQNHNPPTNSSFSPSSSMFHSGDSDHQSSSISSVPSTHAMSNNPAAFYNIKRSSTVMNSNTSDGANSSNVWKGPKSFRNMRVRMRVDCVSRTISILINDELLEPLYFDFPGRVTAAITLCHCLDEVTLENVLMDLVS